MARSRQYPPSVDPGAPAEPLTPSGWSKHSFSDLFEVVERPANLHDSTEYQLVNARRSRGGIVARERLRGHEIRVKTQFTIEAGDFLMSKRQIIHGACGVVPQELAGAVVSNEYAVLRPRPSLAPEYLRYLPEMPYFQRTCFHSSVGVDVEKMVFKLDQWLRFCTPLPPVPEQRKIAAVLASADDAIEKSEAVILQLEAVRAACLEALIIGADADVRTRLGVAADNWVRTSLSEVCTFIGRGRTPKYVDSDSEIRAINQKCVRDGVVSPLHSRPHDARVQVAREAVLTDFDVCVNSTGTGTIGRVGLWRQPSEGTFFADTHVTIVRARPDFCAPPFLSYALQTAEVQREMEATCFTGSTSQVELSRTALAALKVPIPPREEQRKIAAILSSFGDRIMAEQRALEATKGLKSALLDALLSGRVRVNGLAQEAA